MSASEEPTDLADLVRAHAKRRGDAVAFEFEGRRVSYAAFDVHTNRIANGLGVLGVKPRERIAYPTPISFALWEPLGPIGPNGINGRKTT
jgi:fatty-acyl-CoA synthase